MKLATFTLPGDDTPHAGEVRGDTVVEFTSGVLQGYYTPQLTDIARLLAIRDPDVNWLEAAQLLGLRQGTVKTRMMRARHVLRKELA